MAEKSKLGTILVQSHLISPTDVEQALAEQRRSGARFGEALINLGIVSTDDVGWGLSNQLNIPFIHLGTEAIDKEVVKLVPEPLARRHTLIPFLKIDDELTVVMEDPLNQRAVKEVETVSGCKVNICIGLPAEIESRIDQLYGTKSGDSQNVGELETSLFDGAELEKIASDYTGEVFLHTLLDKAMELNASALHFEPQDGRIMVRFRTDNGIEQVGAISEGWYLVLANRIRHELDNAENRGSFVEGFLSHRVNKRRFVYYTSLVKASSGTSITMLNLMPRDFPDSFDDLPLESSDREAILKIIGGRSGMVLVTGRSKIEKLKFIDLLLKKKHAESKKTFVIGSMPWFADSGYIQLGVLVENRSDLLEGIKVAVAQDPDILYIEDAWDAHVLRYTLQANISNIFAMTTLHFPDTLTALEYCTESIDNKTLLTLALRGLIGFHAFRMLCPDCKSRDENFAAQARTLELPRKEVEKTMIFKAEGCRKCNGHGYKDSKFLVETLEMTDELTEFIKAGHKFKLIKELILNSGHRTIRQQAKELVLSGQIGIDDFKNVERR